MSYNYWDACEDIVLNLSQVDMTKLDPDDAFDVLVRFVADALSCGESYDWITSNKHPNLTPELASLRLGLASDRHEPEDT
jgi:hypothetical protein